MSKTGLIRAAKSIQSDLGTLGVAQNGNFVIGASLDMIGDEFSQVLGAVSNRERVRRTGESGRVVQGYNMGALYLLLDLGADYASGNTKSRLFTGATDADEVKATIGAVLDVVASIRLWDGRAGREQGEGGENVFHR